jgi:hypothetical protein
METITVLLIIITCLLCGILGVLHRIDKREAYKVMEELEKRSEGKKRSNP